ncbi:MAG: hypothetical protein U0V49_12610 [Saprospiraceae bacterium]
MKTLNIVVALLFLVGAACQKAKKAETATVGTSPVPATNSNSTPVPSIVKLLKADEEFIKQATMQKPYPMITDSIWSFYFALSISEPTPKDNIYKGHWLDLKEDGRYSKGLYGNTTDEGYYFYDQLKKTVEFRSSIKDTSSEWSVKVDPDAMLLIGTARFNNNPWQIKLLRRSSLPEEGKPLKNENFQK